MSLRLASLRRISRISNLPQARSYATPRNTPPAGLEGLFGGKSAKEGTTVAPKPPGVDTPSEPTPKEPEEIAEPSWKDRRPKLSGQKVATGGGGGGSGGTGGGPGGGPGGPKQFNMSTNQLLALTVA